jgi:3-methyladenine DNA glycosylase AlkC
MNPYPWERPYIEALRNSDLRTAVSVFYETARVAKRRLRSKEIARAIELLEENVLDRQKLWSWAVQLIEGHLSTTLGVRLMVVFFPERPEDVEAVCVRLAEHPDWQRREDAAWMLSELLVAHFGEVYQLCWDWVRHPSENIRRAVVVGVKRAAKVRQPEWSQRFLDLLEPLVSDRRTYVRKNLGPFAVGDGLLRCYPEVTLQRLAEWAERSDEGTRWNVAMAFSAAEAAKHVEAALPILTELAADDRRYMWRAVASAMRNLGRRRPTETVPVLEAWLEDEYPRQVAQVALQYIDETP